MNAALPLPLPDWISQYVCSKRRRATHHITHNGNEWFLRVPTKEQGGFMRSVTEHQHFSPGALVTPTRNAERTLQIQEWARAHLESTDDSANRIGALELAILFHKDCPDSRFSARTIGNAMSWLGYKRMKSRGVNVYTGLKYI